MSDGFYIRKISKNSVENVIKEVGFDKSYIKSASSKYKFELIKIHNLTPPQATIIKQLALSVGGDAALHREVITNKIDKTDLLLGCTQAQLKSICKKLEHQPFGLKKLSALLMDQLNNKPKPLTIRNTSFDWSKKTYIMGILNITPDSFSDGGKYISIESAIEQAQKMISANVDIIDIGGESTRPFSKEVSPEIELERVIPVIKKIREINPYIPISIDTRHSIVAKEAVKAGADIVNDVSGFDFDPNMINIVSELNVPVIIMHSLSNPEDMQVNPEYQGNIIDIISKIISDKAQMAINAGIKKENIILDPGIGFGKTLEHNLEIIRRFEEFASLGYPTLAGVSRKSVIGNILNVAPEEREEANISLASYLASKGANIIRVHDVEKHYKALKVLDKVIKNENS